MSASLFLSDLQKMFHIVKFRKQLHLLYTYKYINGSEKLSLMNNKEKHHVFCTGWNGILWFL